MGQNLEAAPAGSRARLKRGWRGLGLERYSQAEGRRCWSPSTLFSVGKGSENGALVSPSYSQALFQPQRPKAGP